jgi:Zn-finger nucleic acid-binding protein
MSADDMTCPQCQSTMSTRSLGEVTVHQCTSCQGVFLERGELANLVEAENDWHRATGGPLTQPMPRITADMTAPPPSRPGARAYIETLFG